MIFKKNYFSEKVCGTRDPPPFMEKSILNFHFDYLHPSLTHTKERAFKCVHCRNSFGEAGTLKRRVLTHSGVKRRHILAENVRSHLDEEERWGIPYICHFFYTDRIFENQILHPKKRLKAPKTLKMSLKKSYICIFFTHSGKIYTWQKFFTQTCL